MLDLLAYAVLLAGMSQQSIRSETGRYYCEREVRKGNWTGLARIETTESHEIATREFSLRGKAFQATWGLRGVILDVSQPPVAWDLATIRLPTAALYPITASVFLNGQPVWHDRYDKHTTLILGIAPTPTSTSQSAPGLDISVRDKVPPLFGAHTGRVEVKSPDGSLVAEQQIDMPDWTVLRADMDRAFAAVEADWKAGLCRPSYSVLVID